MNNSHTLSLIKETFQKIQEFNYSAYENRLKTLSKNPKPIETRLNLVNKILEKFGLHLTYKSIFDELTDKFYSKQGKWSSVGTLQLALKNPEKFDEVYNLFTDEDSKSTFDLLIKYRVAYAFLGELAGKIFPPKISKEVFMQGMNRLKFCKWNNIVSIGNFVFKSDITEVVHSWIFEQYQLDGKCEVSKRDYEHSAG